VDTYRPADIEKLGIRNATDLTTFLPQQAGGTKNLNARTGGDGTVQFNLRGLLAKETLVLVDGKRVAFGSLNAVGFSGGVDINLIPFPMIDHIDILKDGASAVYGSDAIAGVINFILKKNPSGGSIDATYGGFFDGGGSTTNVNANAGFAPVENSYINLTAQVSNHGHTDRGNLDPRTDPAYFTGDYPNSNIPLAPGYPYINHIQGDAESHFKLVGFKLRASKLPYIAADEQGRRYKFGEITLRHAGLVGHAHTGQRL